MNITEYFAFWEPADLVTFTVAEGKWKVFRGHNSPLWNKKKEREREKGRKKDKKRKKLLFI